MFFNLKQCSFFIHGFWLFLLNFLISFSNGQSNSAEFKLNIRKKNTALASLILLFFTQLKVIIMSCYQKYTVAVQVYQNVPITKVDESLFVLFSRVTRKFPRYLLKTTKVIFF